MTAKLDELKHPAPVRSAEWTPAPIESGCEWTPAKGYEGHSAALLTMTTDFAVRVWVDVTIATPDGGESTQLCVAMKLDGAPGPNDGLKPVCVHWARPVPASVGALACPQDIWWVVLRWTPVAGSAEREGDVVRLWAMQGLKPVSIPTGTLAQLSRTAAQPRCAPWGRFRLCGVGPGPGAAESASYTTYAADVRDRPMLVFNATWTEAASVPQPLIARTESLKVEPLVDSAWKVPRSTIVAISAGNGACRQSGSPRPTRCVAAATEHGDIFVHALPGMQCIAALPAAAGQGESDVVALLWAHELSGKLKAAPCPLLVAHASSIVRFKQDAGAAWHQDGASLQLSGDLVAAVLDPFRKQVIVLANRAADAGATVIGVDCRVGQPLAVAWQRDVPVEARISHACALSTTHLLAMHAGGATVVPASEVCAEYPAEAGSDADGFAAHVAARIAHVVRESDAASTVTALAAHGSGAWLASATSSQHGCTVRIFQVGTGREEAAMQLVDEEGESTSLAWTESVLAPVLMAAHGLAVLASSRSRTGRWGPLQKICPLPSPAQGLRLAGPALVVAAVGTELVSSPAVPAEDMAAVSTMLTAGRGDDHRGSLLAGWREVPAGAANITCAVLRGHLAVAGLLFKHLGAMLLATLDAHREEGSTSFSITTPEEEEVGLFRLLASSTVGELATDVAPGPAAGRSIAEGLVRLAHALASPPEGGDLDGPAKEVVGALECCVAAQKVLQGLSTLGGEGERGDDAGRGRFSHLFGAFSRSDGTKEVAGGGAVAEVVPRPRSGGEGAAPTWHALRLCGVGYWLTDPALARATAERVAKAEYATTRDPEACALWHIALGRKSVLQGLCRVQGNQARLVDFLSRGFESDKDRQAAHKNAFVLLSQRRHAMAAAMFLLGGGLQEAADVCARDLGDVQLALLLCAVSKDPNARAVRASIVERALEEAKPGAERWLLLTALGDDVAAEAELARAWLCPESMVSETVAWADALLLGTESLLQLACHDRVTAAPALLAGLGARLACHAASCAAAGRPDAAVAAAAQWAGVSAATGAESKVQRSERAAVSQALARACTAAVLVAAPRGACGKDPAAVAAAVSAALFSGDDHSWSGVASVLESRGLPSDRPAGDSAAAGAAAATGAITAHILARALASAHATQGDGSADAWLAHRQGSLTPSWDCRASESRRSLGAASSTTVGAAIAPASSTGPLGPAMQMLCLRRNVVAFAACPFRDAGESGRAAAPLLAVCTPQGLRVEAASAPMRARWTETQTRAKAAASAFSRSRSLFGMVQSAIDGIRQAATPTGQDGARSFGTPLRPPGVARYGPAPGERPPGAVVLPSDRIHSRALACHPHRSLLASGASGARVAAWDCTNPWDCTEALATYAFHAEGHAGKLHFAQDPFTHVSQVCFSKCGQRMAGVLRSGTAAAWPIDGPVVAHAGVPDWSHRCFSRKGKDVAFLGSSSSILVVAGLGMAARSLAVWDTATPPAAGPVAVLQTHASGCNCIAQPDGGLHIIAAGKDGALCCYDLRMVGTDERQAPLWVAATPDPSASAHGAGSPAPPGATPLAVPGGGTRAPVTRLTAGRLRVEPDGARTEVAAAGHADGSVTLWDVASGACLQHIASVHRERRRGLLNLMQGWGGGLMAGSGSERGVAVPGLAILDEVLLSCGHEGNVLLHPGPGMGWGSAGGAEGA
ncbi:unnamed protein product [Pedinophyceae sp. YPF-701]|nr:unnamed protein product [Pedinophyceae sp. YPF-701]